MKKLLFFAAAALMMCACGNEMKDEIAMEQNNELTAFDVQKEFQKNSFDWFTENLYLKSANSLVSCSIRLEWSSGSYS